MKSLLLALILCCGAQAQTNLLTLYEDNSAGAQPVSALSAFPATYSFAATPVGSVTVVGARVYNSSSVTVEISALNFVNGSTQSSSFTTDLATDVSLAPGGWRYFNIYFVPNATGSVSATAQMGVNGALEAFTTLQGSGTAAQVALSCTGSGLPSASRCDGSILQPDEQQAIDFGSVATTGSQAITFSLQNGSSAVINPQQLVKLQTSALSTSSAFQMGTLPTAIAPGGTGTFTVTFAPGTAITSQATLTVGSSNFLLQGEGIASVLGDISSLTVTYTDSTGVRQTAQGTASISFGTAVSGSGINPTLLITVSNPATTIDAVSVPSISVSGAGFAISGANPAPASIQPGASITFNVSFTPSAVGNYTGILNIGSRSFGLSAQSVLSSHPTPSISVDQNPLMSQQQAHVSVQLATAASTQEIGVLTMTFAPSVANISDDPAIQFVSTNGRQLQVTVASGSQSGSYNGQNAITFQTGTTAGTITFSLQFPNQPAVTQSYTISPAAVQITSASALRQSPNLVVTLSGYDNSYSAGQLSFTFYDTSGKTLTADPISVNASSSFHQYFFGATQVGGAFALQASFPVSGDITQVGSVAVSVGNSAGTSSTKQSFQ